MCNLHRSSVSGLSPLLFMGKNEIEACTYSSAQHGSVHCPRRAPPMLFMAENGRNNHLRLHLTWIRPPYQVCVSVALHGGKKGWSTYVRLYLTWITPPSHCCSSWCKNENDSLTWFNLDQTSVSDQRLHGPSWWKNSSEALTCSFSHSGSVTVPDICFHCFFLVERSWILLTDVISLDQTSISGRRFCCSSSWKNEFEALSSCKGTELLYLSKEVSRTRYW